MPLSEHKKQKLNELLTTRQLLFPEIYDAVSEQVLLLMFKARQLSQNPTYSAWFAEQHRVLSELCKKKEQIADIYKRENYAFGYKEESIDEVLNALGFMHQLYNGFDSDKVSLKTWGEMNKPPVSRRGAFDGATAKWQEFINDDLFQVLVSCKTSCSSIPQHDRQGYSHQDLSIAYSQAELLIRKLNKWFCIDRLQLLSEAVYLLIKEYKDHRVSLPKWLSRFENVHTNGMFADISTHNGYNKIYGVLKLVESDFITDVQNDADEREAEILLDLFNKVSATHIYKWLEGITCYLKYNQVTTSYIWKFRTIALPPDEPKTTQGEGKSAEWDRDYCQISISRDTLLELIQKHNLQDATRHLSSCLTQLYCKSAVQNIEDVSTSIPEQELQVNSSNNWIYGSHFNEDLRERAFFLIGEFEKWYKQNKVLLISYNAKRMEKISVESWLAGLMCYDLKKGIPDSTPMKINGGIYDKVRTNKDLLMPKGKSDISWQRYYGRVKEVIDSRIDDLILQQQTSNRHVPYSGANGAIQPLWGKE